MENKIKKIVKKEKFDFENIHFDHVERLFYALECENITSFSVYVRSSFSGDDSWLQTEYYSEALGKTIIWDYDTQHSFEDIDELVDFIERTNKELLDFEKKLPKLSILG